MTYDDTGYYTDEYVDSLPLMDSPIPVLTILVIYWLFIFFGPRFMKDRKPFELNKVLIVYNMINVTVSTCILWQLTDYRTLHIFLSHLCTPVDPSNVSYLNKVNRSSYIYLLSKLTELLDTVFFILRKKQNQVTFLHVYHHSNMAISTWAYTKYIRGELGTVIGVVNSAVHVVMYSYYLLTAMGPEVQKYLWWKKYITKLQLGQFVCVLLTCFLLLINNCKMHKALTYYSLSQAVIFFILFMNFYIKSYFKKDARDDKETTKS